MEEIRARQIASLVDAQQVPAVQPSLSPPPNEYAATRGQSGANTPPPPLLSRGSPLQTPFGLQVRSMGPARLARRDPAF